MTEMTEATRDLLLKARKGATAGFEVKQWGIVLTALGCGYATLKERNTVVQVSITTPEGKYLVIAKEPNYRRITFYKLHSFLKDAGFNLVERASAALGMDTPDVEKALKELYVRDLTNTGTCPVCEGNFKRDGAKKMVHHGYQRPGDGYIHGDCFAVGYRCWEESAEGAMAYVQLALRPFLAQQEITLAALKSGEIKSFSVTKHRWVGYRQEKYTEMVTEESDAVQFKHELEGHIYETEKRIRWATEDIARFEARIAAWKPDVLPEIKHAGKFKVA